MDMAEHNNKDGEFRTFSAGDLSERSVYQLRRLRENHPEGFSTALKILADGSRCEDRREAYGKTGILEYLLELQATMLDIEVRRECLRAIANSCADTDGNRDRVISSSYFAAILGHLTDEYTIHVALAALYNISLDYDPAQYALRKNGLFLKLINILDDPNLDYLLVSKSGQSSTLQHITGLLGFAVEDYDINQSLDTVLLTLFKYIINGDPGLEEIFPLLNAVGAHLKHDRFKALLFEQGLFELFLVSILRFFGYTGSSRIRLSEIFSLDASPDDDIEDLESAQTALVATLRDLSFSPAFMERYPFGSADIGSWFTWLHSESADLQLLSCCILSNYARAREDWAEEIIIAHNVQMRLVCLCVQKPESRVALATLELLLQLARPRGNRARICGHDFLERLSSIWKADRTEPSGIIRTQYASIAVLLGLITDCAPAVQRLIGHTAPGSPEDHVSYLQSLLSCYVHSNDRKVQTEIAKVVMEICKTAVRFEPRQTACPSSDAIMLSCLSIQPAYATPISIVVAQTEDPILQAQGYFTLVIVARQQLGVMMVNNVMRQRRVFEHLVQAVIKQSATFSETVQDPPEKIDPARWAAVQRSVHENAVCLVKEIIDRKDPQLPCDWLELLSDVLRSHIENVPHLMTRAMPLLTEDKNNS